MLGARSEESYIGGTGSLRARGKLLNAAGGMLDLPGRCGGADGGLPGLMGECGCGDGGESTRLDPAHPSQ
jgi:hypothetical protein